jgi:RNA polymerase-binding transcription factor DksA
MPAKKKSASQNASKSAGSGDKPKASDLLKRTRHQTPTIFKVGSRKHAPIIFTLEDVREILKHRKKEERANGATEAPRAKKVAKPATEKPAPAPEMPTQKSVHAAASLADILGFGTAPVAPTPTAKAAPKGEVPKKFRKFHALLLELRAHVQESLGMHAEDTLKRSQKEDSGDISTSADAGTDNFDRDFALSVVSSEQEALREIDAAIKRILNGSYGVCEITGEPISEERLEAVPFTRYSLEGQRQFESTARRRVQRGGSFLGEGGADAIGFGDDDGDN